MQRVIQGKKILPESVARGVCLHRIQPGGVQGPHGEVTQQIPGGSAWNDNFAVGRETDDFMMLVPDVRMPPNQYWPLHWHDCWIAVVILEGSCVIGDWWMQPGDVLVTAAELEYGPLLVGPGGVQLFEVFARLHLHQGGYAPEYQDHPTLQGTTARFKERSALNRRNAGHQILPLDGVAGVSKGHLSAGAQWNLGDAADPDRGVMRDTRLAAGARLAPHTYGDWHALFLLNGSLRLNERELTRNDVLIVEPGGDVAAIEAGRNGAQLLELARTARGIESIPVA
jgi:hypothetical protein